MSRILYAGLMNEQPRQPRMEVIPPSRRLGGQDACATPLPPAIPEPRIESTPQRAPVAWWRVLLAAVPGTSYVMGLWFYMLDEDANAMHRLALLCACIYLVYPMDLINDVLARFMGIGYLDDLALFWFIARSIGSENLRPYRLRARNWLLGFPIQ